MSGPQAAARHDASTSRVAEPATAPRPDFVPETILVYVGAELIGDGLLKLPFLRALRNAFPAARVTWLAGKARTVFAHELAPLVAGLIDEVIEDAGIGSRYIEAIGRPLPDRQFDLILDTQRRVVTTLAVRRIRHRRFISACAGYVFSDVKPPGRRALSNHKPPALIDQMLELIALGRTGRTDAPLETGGLPVLPEAVAAEAARLLPEGGDYVALSPGAGSRNKCWPLDSFEALAGGLIENGLVPVFALGPNEQEWYERLRATVPGAQFPMQEAPAAAEMEPLASIAVAARCLACVANDSGGGHLLAASNSPLISLFGPTSPAKFAPRVPQLTVIEAASYGSRDMSAIPVEAVLAAVMEMAANQRQATAGTRTRRS